MTLSTRHILFAILVSIAFILLPFQGVIFSSTLHLGEHLANEETSVENACGTEGCAMAASMCTNHCVFSASLFDVPAATLAPIISVTLATIAILFVLPLLRSTKHAFAQPYIFSDRYQLLTVMKRE